MFIAVRHWSSNSSAHCWYEAKVDRRDASTADHKLRGKARTSQSRRERVAIVASGVFDEARAESGRLSARTARSCQWLYSIRAWWIFRKWVNRPVLFVLFSFNFLFIIKKLNKIQVELFFIYYKIRKIKKNKTFWESILPRLYNLIIHFFYPTLMNNIIKKKKKRSAIYYLTQKMFITDEKEISWTWL